MSASGTKKSNLKRTSSRGTQKKHVRINPDKNEVVEFERPFKEEEKTELWTSNAETQRAVNESLVEEDSVHKNKTPRPLRKQRILTAINRANKELNARKNLPKLAATIARGKFNIKEKDDSPPKLSKTNTEVIQIKKTDPIRIPIPRTPLKDKTKKDNSRQLTLFERMFGKKKGGRTRKTKKNRKH
jgi:hypothetical protein